jgi:peptidoglycan/xylan/chitin deacetylase (PgdA/CDA1 family)
MLREVESRGWEIGSHCDEHVHLARRAENEQEELIDAGLRRIEDELGYRPTSFAYPYGSHDESTVAALKKCRVRIAVTTERPGTGELDPASDPLRIKRLAVGGWAWHHYLKTLIRTLRVVGVANIGRGVVANWSLPAPQTTKARPAASHILP